MKPTLMILAAGVGSRYGKLKQLDGMGPNNEALFEYAIFDAIRAGFGKVVFIINHKIKDRFLSFVKGKFEDKIEVVFVYQELDTFTGGILYSPERKKPWGTGHAVLVAKGEINGPFVMINADDFYGREAFEAAAAYMKMASDYFIVGYSLDNTLSPHGAVNRGILTVDDDSNLSMVVERMKIKKSDSGYTHEEDGREVPLHEKNPLVSMNMIGYPVEIFEELQYRFDLFMRSNGFDLTGEFLIPTVLNEMMAQIMTTVKVVKTDSSWFGVTFPEDKPVVQQRILKLVNAGVYPPDLWK